MSNAAFDDLNIDFSDMMTNPAAFGKRVMETAEHLKNILKTDSSSASYRRKLEEAKVDADTSVIVCLNGAYNYADDLPIEQMPAIIEAAKRLVKDLETQFEDRVLRSLADETNSMYDKKVASLQYAALRNAYNDYADFINGFMKKLVGDNPLEKIPSLPGNWGRTTGLKHYLFTYEGENYYHHNTVLRKLGLDDMYYHDAKEFFNDNPKYGVEVKEIL